MFRPIRLEIASNRPHHAVTVHTRSKRTHKHMRITHALVLAQVGTHMRWVYPRPHSRLRSLSRRIHASRRHAIRTQGRTARNMLERTYTYIRIRALYLLWFFLPPKF